MGFFSFLKREQQIIKFDEVKDWILKQVEDKNFNSKTKDFNQETKIRINEIGELLKDLEKATLLNENIPERLKHIMDGNRKNYVRKITLFLNEIILPKEYEDVESFVKDYTNKLDELSKETQKSYMVLKEFVEKDLSKVVRKIKEIEDTAIKLQEYFEKEKLHELKKLKEQLELYIHSKQNILELKKLKEKYELELTEAKAKEEKIKIKISKIKTDKNFKACESLKKEQEEITLKIKEQKKNITTHFLPMDRAFKKYKRLSLNEKLIDEYLNNPVSALLKDDDLQILTIMEHMSSSIKNLNLKDKQQESIKQEIKLLNKEFLQKLREDMNELYAVQQNNKTLLLANTSALNLSEQESWLENTQKNIREKAEQITNLKQKIKKTNPENVKITVKKLLKEFDVEMKDE